MNKALPLLAGLLVLSSCWGDNPTSSSIFSFSAFDYFNKQENNQTIRRQYVVHRQFSLTDIADDPVALLNPLNYPEDASIDPHYRVSGAQIGDFSSENISFASKNNVLSQYIEGITNTRLSVNQVNGLIDILDHNDEFINTQNIFYYDRNLSEDLDHGSYYAFNNFFRQETSVVQRYPSHVVQGVGEGSMLYQDEFEVDFSFQTQIFGTDSTIYQLRDETFPEGIRTAKDSKATSLRVEENLKKALTIGGGGQAKRFIETYREAYQLTGGVLDPNEYAYTLRGEKTSEHTKLTFYIYRPIPGLFQNQTLQDMTLNYEVYIRDGYVTDIVARQTLFEG